MNNRILVGIFFFTSVLICIFPYVQKQKENINPPVIEQVVPQTPPEVIEQTIPQTDPISSIKQDDLKQVVSFLTVNGRKTGTEENNIAADSIEMTLKQFGLSTEKHAFKLGNDTTQNVYAWIEGKDKNKVIIVGAHYDGLGTGYPGADDNASGTAGVIILARAFALMKDLPCTVVFQFYSAEEEGLHGSEFYVRYPRFPREKPDLKTHIVMYNLDMIGELNGRDPSTCLSDEFSKGSSDHLSFQKRGIPTVNVHTGTGARTIHTAQDTAEKLDYIGMESIVKLVFQRIISQF